MRGGYDLYGNYYPNLNDAMNAEMAQCNEIDNRYNQKKKLKNLKQNYNNPIMMNGLYGKKLKN